MRVESLATLGFRNLSHAPRTLMVTLAELREAGYA